MHQIRLSDDLQILVVERSELLDLVRRQEKVSAVLVSMDEPFSQEFVEQLVTLYLLGCEWFLCSGALSEQLHDAIDEQLFQRGYTDAATTFEGEDESIEDVIALFLAVGEEQGSRLKVYVPDKSSRGKAILAELESASVV